MSNSENARQLKRVSKFCALMLRHSPDSFDLDPDADGFVPLGDFLAVFAAHRRFQFVTEATIRQIIATSDKPRYEIREATADEPAKIRARYGHSYLTVTYAPCVPPKILYHGTSVDAETAIRETGLHAMKRKYVHLTTDEDMAVAVGNRHGGRTVLLSIRAAEAHAAGLPFFNPAPQIYLATDIPPQFIDWPTG